jgi:hypothetical protein
MRCELFGDIRDLFKYDVATEIARALHLRFVFIPMLMPDQGRHGNLRGFDRARAQGRPGTKNQFLLDHLKQHQEPVKRCVQHIGPYFKHEGIGFHLHEHARHGDGVFFNHQDRVGYFGERLAASLSSALLFLDPDNGLEVGGSNEQHVLYSDLQDLLARLGNDSVVMVYQQFPREERGPYTSRRLHKLSQLVNQPPCCISDNEILFFFLTKTAERRQGLVDVLRQYSQRYPDRTVVSGC